MPISLTKSAAAILSAFALSSVPLMFATIVEPAPSWAACDAAPAGDGVASDCAPPPADPPPAAAAPGLPALPPFNPSDIKVNPPTFEGFNGGGVSWSWPQLCGPNIQTPIPFVGFQPCI